MRADAYDVWGNHTANDLEETLENIFTQNISDEQAQNFFGNDGALFGKDDDAPFNMLWTGIPDYLIPDDVKNAQGKFQILFHFSMRLCSTFLSNIFLNI